MSYMNKHTRVVVIAAVLGLGIGFSAGYYMPHGAGTTARGQYAMRGGANMDGGFSGARGGSGGLVSGTVLSNDGSTMTVSMQDGSTKLVLIHASTEVLETTMASPEALSAGVSVTVTGTANSDGSVTAQSVQVRPAGLAPRGSAQ